MGLGKKRSRPGEKPQYDTTEEETQFNDSLTKNGSEGGLEGSVEEMEPTESLAEVMKDHLELMLDIIMRIRDDPLFAKSIYSDCPRLQHMLDQRPDLRPIFEDPRLVRITFERAFVEAGGELPDDKPKSIMAAIVNHPAFKFLRFLIFLKKLYGCLQAGGMNALKKWVKDMFKPDTAAKQLAEESGGNGDGGPDSGGDNKHNPDSDPDDPNHDGDDSKDVLNDAADKFEDPEMREKLERLKSIDDPEQLAEEIENDQELSALRDSNELCAELMSDPDTINIMLEPENLRALGECPDLIEADISSPDWTLDVDGGEQGVDSTSRGGLDVDVDSGHEATGENGVDNGAVFDGDGDLEEEFDEEEEPEEEEEEEEEEGLEYALGEEEIEDKPRSQTARSRGKNAKQKPNPKSRAAQRQAQTSNFFTNVGVGLTDLIGGEIVAMGADELMGGGDDGLEALDEMGDMEEYGGMMDEMDADELLAIEDGADELLAIEDGADELLAIEDCALDGMEDAADDAAEEAGEACNNLVETLANAVGLLGEDDICDNLDQLEEGLDTAEEVHEESAEKSEQEDKAPVTDADAETLEGKENEEEENKSRAVGDGDAEEPELPPPPKKFGRFKMLGNLVGAMATAAKETIATNLLGDDIGAMVVEKLEEEPEEEEEEEGSDDDSTKKNDHDEDDNDIESGVKNEDQEPSTIEPGGFAAALDNGSKPRSGGFAAALDV